MRLMTAAVLVAQAATVTGFDNPIHTYPSIPGTGIRTMISADVNRDGYDDLLTMGRGFGRIDSRGFGVPGTEEDQLQVWLSLANGAFAGPLTQTCPIPDCGFVAGSLTGGGGLDIITDPGIWFRPFSLRLFPSEEDGLPGEPLTIALPEGEIAIATFIRTGRDGAKLDVFHVSGRDFQVDGFVRYGPLSLTTYRWAGSGLVRERSLIIHHCGGDIVHDRLLVRRNEGGYVIVPRGSQQGIKLSFDRFGRSFRKATIRLPFDVQDFQISDLDGDGREELAGISSSGIRGRLFVQRLSGRLLTFQYPLLHSPGRLRTADFNGDGLTDVVLSQTDHGRVWFGSLYLGSERGLQELPAKLRIERWGFSVGDFDGDGLSDLASFMPNQIWSLLNHR
ncbi:MAG TPA: VCBS repeat-containing protein [Candidatus Paceibacterota bacterium]|nr:VCBS repeat-containing protein [Candidatus Paceibacterota bacterium]